MTEDESPFRSPSVESTQAPLDEEIRLLEIVKYQRFTALANVSFSVWLTTYFAHAMFLGPLPRSTIWIYLILLAGIILVSVYPVSFLALRVYSTFIAILWIVFTLTGFGGLIAMTFIHSKATRVLKEHGLQPGFLGMSRSAAIAQLNEAKANEPTSKPAAPSIPRIDRLQ